jgi:hypothetical protein
VKARIIVSKALFFLKNTSTRLFAVDVDLAAVKLQIENMKVTTRTL